MGEIVIVGLEIIKQLYYYLSKEIKGRSIFITIIYIRSVFEITTAAAPVFHSIHTITISIVIHSIVAAVVTGDFSIMLPWLLLPQIFLWQTIVATTAPYIATFADSSDGIVVLQPLCTLAY